MLSDKIAEQEIFLSSQGKQNAHEAFVSRIYQKYLCRQAFNFMHIRNYCKGFLARYCKYMYPKKGKTLKVFQYNL